MRDLGTWVWWLLPVVIFIIMCIVAVYQNHHEKR
jgi:cytochrome c-type biogenesis protein CcmH/NrfF